MNAVWFACEQITSASKHDSSTCESSLLTRRVCWHLASSQSFLHVTCLAGILSLLIPSTKIIFRTQIFNFFCLFLGLLCFFFLFFLSAAGVIQGNLVSWSLRCPFLSFLVVSVTTTKQRKSCTDWNWVFQPVTLIFCFSNSRNFKEKLCPLQKTFCELFFLFIFKKGKLKCE